VGAFLLTLGGTDLLIGVPPLATWKFVYLAVCGIAAAHFRFASIREHFISTFVRGSLAHDSMISVSLSGCMCVSRIVRCELVIGHE
jgi:hypothetical protein